MYLAFVKAFDFVSQRLLGFKLLGYGIHPQLVPWVRSFRRERTPGQMFISHCTLRRTPGLMGWSILLSMWMISFGLRTLLISSPENTSTTAIERCGWINNKYRNWAYCCLQDARPSYTDTLGLFSPPRCSAPRSNLLYWWRLMNNTCLLNRGTTLTSRRLFFRGL